MAKKKKNEDELKKAGEHLIRATAEGIIGAGVNVDCNFNITIP